MRPAVHRQARVASPLFLNPWPLLMDLAGNGAATAGGFSLPAAPGAVLASLAILLLLFCDRVRHHPDLAPRYLILSNPIPPG